MAAGFGEGLQKAGLQARMRPSRTAPKRYVHWQLHFNGGKAQNWGSWWATDACMSSLSCLGLAGISVGKLAKPCCG